VEAPVRRAELGHELERGVERVLGDAQGRRAVVPRTVVAGTAERVGPGAFERVPVRHGELQVFGHGFAGDLLPRVVELERQRIPGVGSFVSDLPLYLRKVGAHV